MSSSRLAPNDTIISQNLSNNLKWAGEGMGRQGEMGRWGDGEMGRWGWGDEGMGGQGDGGMGGQGEK